ncbi:MAG: tetratricopeptide repeat protein, partial [Thermodesulfovibrionales bacterium]
ISDQPSALSQVPASEPAGKLTTVADYSLFTTHYLLSPPFIAALLFATHPIHTEVVAWVGAVTDLSFTFFYLLSLYFYMRSGIGFKKHDYLFSVILFPFALLCKEPAATLPVVLMAYDLAYGKKGERLLIYVKRHLPYMVILGIYLLVRASVLGGLAPVKAHAELSTYQFVINVFPLFSQYLERLLFPINLNAFYTLHPISSMGEMKGLLGLLITAAYGLITIIANKKNQTAFFSLVLIAVPLLPALYIPGTGEASFAERYLYLPSMGFVVLVSLFLTWLRGKMSRYKSGIILFVLALAGIYSLQTIGRNPIWKDNLVLFTDTVHKSPDAELPRGMLGNVLMDMGRLDEAMEQYSAIIKLNPNSPEAHRNLGLAYKKKGMKKEAIEEYQKAVAIAPADFEARRGLVLAYEEAGLLDEEIKQYRILLDYTPKSAETHGRLGKALAKKGMREEAISHLKQAVALNPDYIDAHYSLGSLYADSGKTEEALENFKAAVRLAPDDAFYRNILGIAYGQKGLFDKAVEQFEAAVRLAPSESSYRANLERALKLKKSAGMKE